MCIHLIYPSYLTPDGVKMSIGGVQTYIYNLCAIFTEEGYDVSIYQLSNESFIKTFGKVTVYGVDRMNVSVKKRVSALYEVFRPKWEEGDLLIWGTDGCICKNDIKNSIVIQHGIFWDIPNKSNSYYYNSLIGYLHKAMMAWRMIQRANMAAKIVCVDYNYVNWHRAIVQKPKVLFNVVPNFTHLPASVPVKLEDGIVRIIFARRFYEYRGTRIFTEAIKRILNEYANVDVTMAGDGPDKEWMKAQLVDYSNVHFISYKSNESLLIHLDKDIAVVPTVGSEGTSLSLLEAMASKCAVICSNVGGMTNIILDGYNGLMIEPTSDNIYLALKQLLDNPEQRGCLACKAYETSSHAFSFENWKKRWLNIIK